MTTNQGVSVLDAQTGQVVRTLTLAHGAEWALVAPTAGHLFVVSRGADSTQPVTLRMVEIRTGRVLRTRSFGPEAMVSAVDDHTGRVFVSSATKGTVATLDAASGAMVQTVHVGGFPAAAAVAPQAGHVFVIDSTGDTVSTLDARTGGVLRTIHGSLNPSTIGVDTATGRVFIGAQHAIEVLDARTGALLHSIPIDTPPASLPLALPSQGEVAVVLQTPSSDQDQSILGPGQVVILDGKTGAIRRRVDVGLEQSYGFYDIIGVDPWTHRLFVLNEQGAEVFDTNQLR